MSFEDIALVSMFALPAIWCRLPQKKADKIKAFIRRHKLLKGILVLLAIVSVIYALHMATRHDMMVS